MVAVHKRVRVGSVLRTEVSCGDVAFHSLLLRARRDHHDTFGLGPRKQNLFGLRIQAGCYIVHRRVDRASGTTGDRNEGAVGLADNAVLVPELNRGDLLMEVVRMNQDLSEICVMVSDKSRNCHLLVSICDYLVCRRQHLCGVDEGLQLSDSKVAHADTLDKAICFELLHLRPCRGDVRSGKPRRVYEVQVNILDAKL